MKRALGSAIILVLLVGGLGSQALAAGHYELVWFRMWDRSENSGCTGHHVFQVWVFDEQGNRMGNVAIRDQDGNCIWDSVLQTYMCHATSAPPESKRAEIPIWLDQAPFGVKCVDGNGSTSDVTPLVSTQFLPCLGHYSFEAGFVFKANGSTPGQADSTLIGDPPQVGDNDGDYGAAYTASMVYAGQDRSRYASADAWQLLSETGGGTRHSQTFVATNVNRILGVFAFPVQAGNGSTVWRASVQVGGPEGPTICEATTPFDVYYGTPVAFAVDACPVTPGEVYAFTMEPLQPSNSNVYTYPNNNFANGQYYHNGQLQNANRDVYGHAWAWDRGPDPKGYIAGRIKDTNGDALRNGLVTLKDASGSATIATTTSGRTGSYVFKTVDPGTYTVTVDLAGFDPGSTSGIAVTAEHYTIADFTLTPQLQELTNPSFELGSLYAWVPYGGIQPAVFASGVAGLSAVSGTYYAAIAGTTTTGGIYQRASVLPGEGFEAVYNVNRVSGSAVCRIGVDLTGGTDPAAGTVQWSPSSSSAGAWSTDGDPNKIVAFTSTGPYATVFVECTATGAGAIVALDNVRLYRTTGPDYSQTTAFDAGWNLTSAPLLSGGAGDPVTAVFDDVVAAGNSLEGNLHRFNASTQTYESYSGGFVNATQGCGYWMNLLAGATETVSGPVPLDPVSQALGLGWNLIGQPHRYGTPLSGLVFVDGQVPAWHDNPVDGLMKYRSDGPWTWTSDTLTVVEWEVYIRNRGYTDRYPRIKFREDAEYLFGYDERNGWWELPGGTRTAGGVMAGGAYRVLMAPDSWHTVRASLNGATGAWSLTIDGLTDAAHHVEGVGGSGGSGSGYVQLGVQSSGKDADFYTSHIYWGQGAEVDNWPASKMYDASVAHTAPEFPYGSFPGWGKEISNNTRSYSPIGAVTKSLAEAAEAGWVENAAVGYDGGYTVVSPAGGDDTSLRAWQGYWLKVNQPNLSVKIPGPAEAIGVADDTASKIRLSLNAPGCITSNFIAAMSPSATDGYEATKDVTAPPAGPAAQKEVRFGTTQNSALMLQDVRALPASGDTKVWSCTAQPVNFTGGECQTVTVTWDVSQAAPQSYVLVDVGQAVSTPMLAGGSYAFEICQGQSPVFEIRAGERYSRVDYDQNGRVDDADAEHFEMCATGPGVAQADLECRDDGDLDGDGDVDQADFAMFQSCYSGSDPADPDCPL